jgi:hypothetical protein
MQALLERREYLQALEARLDAAARKCSVGYGCGSTCISAKKECLVESKSSTSRERIQRLGQLARGEVTPQGIGNLKPEEARRKARELRAQRAEQTAVIKAERERRQAEAAAAGKSRPKVVVNLRRAQVGGEVGPDGHWYPGGSWMSEGSYVGAKPEPPMAAGRGPGADTQGKGRSGDDRAPRVVNPRPPKPPPLEPKGLGLPAPKGLGKRAAANDDQFFNERGYLIWPRPRGASSLQGLDFVAALAQRMPTEQLQWANRQLMRGVEGEAAKDLAWSMRMVRQSLQPGTFENYEFQKRGGKLSGVDSRRWAEAYKLMQAGVWARPSSEATRRRRERANQEDSRVLARDGSQEEVWRLNNVFRAVRSRFGGRNG